MIDPITLLLSKIPIQDCTYYVEYDDSEHIFLQQVITRKPVRNLQRTFDSCRYTW